MEPDDRLNGPAAVVDFCGELYPVSASSSVTIGREGTLVIDDNPYLHRRFLEVSLRAGLPWITNLGSALSATIADDAGLMQAWLGPGAQMPLVFAKTVVWFTAGPTTYELDVHLTEPTFAPPVVHHIDSGSTTVGRMSFTPDQKLLILALAENVLRRGNRGAGTIPPSSDAAVRLGWTITKFNRKLDNVCDKLDRAGIRGLRGGPEKLATARRARLVEYAVAARLVVTEDLLLLDQLGVPR